MKSLSLSKLTILLFTGLFFTLVSCEQPKPNLPEKAKTDVETDPMKDTVSERGFTYAEFASSIKLTDSQTVFLPQLWELWKAEKWTELEKTINQPGDTLNYGYPPANGFINMELVTLPVGKTLDRYGYLGGSFVADEGASFGSRSLRTSSRKAPYYTFVVTKEIPDVSAGKSIPWFGEPGMGMQYNFADSIGTLVNLGYLKITKNVPAKK
jgi:hypothetical protein